MFMNSKKMFHKYLKYTTRELSETNPTKKQMYKKKQMSYHRILRGGEKEEVESIKTTQYELMDQVDKFVDQVDNIVGKLKEENEKLKLKGHGDEELKTQLEEVTAKLQKLEGDKQALEEKNSQLLLEKSKESEELRNKLEKMESNETKLQEMKEEIDIYKNMNQEIKKRMEATEEKLKKIVE